MTKAQAVRRKQLEAMQMVSMKAKGIFNWILALIDSKIEVGDFSATEVCVKYRQPRLIFYIGKCGNDFYTLPNNLPEYPIDRLFIKLKEIIEEEIGFSAELELFAEVDEDACIILKVSIE